jgi:hypothetical protein
MNNPQICKECKKSMFKFRQFFICVNPKCKLEGLFKTDVEKLLPQSAGVHYA